MSFEVKVILDTLAPSRSRLTTFQLTYPRFIHSEVMTHRQFSRNASSSRAIPVEKMLRRVSDDPAMPIHWGLNQRGMQAEREVDLNVKTEAMRLWLQARRDAVTTAQQLASLGCHKQVVNRLLEPFAWMTTIVSATEWTNFFSQRCHKDAQPEFRHLAMMMAEQYYDNSKPTEVGQGMWHTPYLFPEEYHQYQLLDKLQMSVARCARVSYLTQDGRRDVSEDLRLYRDLEAGMHWSPFEHVAMAVITPERSGNFVGFIQYRKSRENECRTTFDWAAIKQAEGV
jgi:thymidylate synthase ThyX